MYFLVRKILFLQCICQSQVATDWQHSLNVPLGWFLKAMTDYNYNIFQKGFTNEGLNMEQFHPAASNQTLWVLRALNAVHGL